MTTTHHPIDRTVRTTPTTTSCLRHRVWMAVCDDCRAAHADLLNPKEGRTAPPAR